MNKETLVKLTAVNKSFGPTRALVNVSLDLRRGEIRGLIGENGSGKSTLASIVAGTQPADSGEMLLRGERYRPTTMLEGVSSGVGMVVQELGTVSGISVAENLFLGRMRRFGKFGFVNKRRMIAAAREALAEMGLSDIDPSRSINSLDLQDRKLMEVTGVVIGAPDLLIFDETTTALSQRGRSLVYELAKKLKAENRSVLFVSHDLEEIMETCDVVTVLRDGHLVENLERADFSESRIKQLMIGRELEGDYYRSDFDPTYSDEVVIKVDNLTTMNGLSGFSMQLHKGEILGVGGLSHCGMHELGRALFGLERALGGRVVHMPSGSVIKNPRGAMSNGVAYVPKDRDREALVLANSVKANIVSAGYDKITSGRIFMSPRKEKRYADAQIDHLSIKCASREQHVQFLSGGNRQKVVFGKWVGRGSDILILDCPTRGVDIGVKYAMYQLMYQMKKEGKSLVLISEELPELVGMSDRLLILKDGKQTAEFKRSRDLTEAKIIDYMI
jgi:ribose transport system ATP-binding protein